MGIREFDGVAEEKPAETIVRHSLWGSARLTYTICAFLAMVLHLCMRNVIQFSVLYMIKESEPANTTLKIVNNTSVNVFGSIAWTPEIEPDVVEVVPVQNETTIWSRSEQLTIQGIYFYGAVITMPFGGYLSDRFGGKFFFVHSLTAQAVVFMLTPICANWSYLASLVLRFIQGLIAGVGNAAIYQLFTTWAHHTERTVLVSIAYTGFSVGSSITFPLTGYLCSINWETAFYIVGAVSLVFGISCIWLVYNTLEEHPRISFGEHAFLRGTNQEKEKATSIPWKAILTSVPVYAFILTHIFHSYGIILLSMMMPRFLKEGLSLSILEAGWFSSTPFFGACLTKVFAIPLTFFIETRTNLNLTLFRKIWYAANMGISMVLLLLVVLTHSTDAYIINACMMGLGAVLELAFSMGYWPVLLYMTPSFAGFLSGIANSLSTFSGFLIPYVVAALVQNGDKSEWDVVVYSVMVMNCVAAVVFTLFSSSKLQPWNK